MFFLKKQRDFPVDLVYLWCDGSDPAFAERRQRTLATFEGKEFKPDAIIPERFSNHGELKYSLRSVTRFLPWIHRIFILMDQNPPDWLNTDAAGLTVVQHKEVFPEGITGPFFNSTAIETFLHRIPGLAEHFIFSNDDNFVGRPLDKSFFFTKEGTAIQYVYPNNLLRNRLQDGQYESLITDKIWDNIFARMIVRSNKILFDEFGVELCISPSHNMDAFNRSVLEEQVEHSPLTQYVQETRKHPFREDSDLHRTAFVWRAYLQGKLKLRYLPLHHPRWEQYIKLSRRQRVCGTLNEFRQIEIGKTPLFCFNGTQGKLEEYYQEYQRFCERNFSEKSPFEK